MEHIQKNIPNQNENEMKNLFGLVLLAGLFLASCNKEEGATTLDEENLLTRIKTEFKGEMVVSPAANEDWAWEMRGDYLGTLEASVDGKELNYEITVSHQSANKASVIGWNIPTLSAELVYYPQEDMYSTYDGTNPDPDFIVNYHRARKELSFAVKQGSRVFVGQKTE